MLLFNIKHNKKLQIKILIIIIITLILVGLIGYNIYEKTTHEKQNPKIKEVISKDKLKKEADEEEQIEESTKETENIIYYEDRVDIEEVVIKTPKSNHKNEGVEITDINILSELSNDIDEILKNERNKEFSKNSNYSVFDYHKWILKSNLTSEDKQAITERISLQVTKKWSNITDDNWKKVPELKSFYDGASSTTRKDLNNYIKQISKEELNKESKRIFGIDIPTYKKTYAKNLHFFYEPTSQNYYVLLIHGGGATSIYDYGYKSSFRLVGDTAYVYMSFAYLEEFDKSSAPNDEIIKIYKDFKIIEDNPNNNILINRYQKNKTVTSINQFNLNESNYQNFSEYEFKFKKDSNGNFYFENIQQIK